MISYPLTLLLFVYHLYRQDDAHKARQFPLDCQELATAQCIYAYQLKDIGVVDEIIWEKAAAADNEGGARETYQSFPVLKERIHSFLARSLAQLCALSPDELVAHRYRKVLRTVAFLSDYTTILLLTHCNNDTAIHLLLQIPKCVDYERHI